MQAIRFYCSPVISGTYSWSVPAISQNVFFVFVNFWSIFWRFPRGQRDRGTKTGHVWSPFYIRLLYVYIDSIFNYFDVTHFFYLDCVPIFILRNLDNLIWDNIFVFKFFLVLINVEVLFLCAEYKAVYFYKSVRYQCIILFLCEILGYAFCAALVIIVR